ncbi:DNA polymerase III subunit epsilon [Buchnera aphidicola (Eriosoma grossulariae)]|uniref:DNA polymerase III subunit epsilon n=1 Tax=Buchnera aphidicola TaxID=9 RepID=UPI003463E331
MNKLQKRQIVLDTETTGMNITGVHYLGHKIIEIGAVEIINRKLTGNNFHVYIQPNRIIEQSAFLIHGISNDFLLNKPKFINIVNNFLNYIKGTELILHNANFDISFIDYELKLLNMNFPLIKNICKITDSLSIARKIFPGKKNNLDALCLRYNIPVNRNTHSAILDAKILAKIYLLMTLNQEQINFSNLIKNDNLIDYKIKHNPCLSKLLKNANPIEINNHEIYLKNMIKKSGKCIWKEKLSIKH